jgi:hypothetical protein
MHTLLDRMRQAYLQSRCLVRRVARYMFADDQHVYTPVRAGFRPPPPSRIFRGFDTNNVRDLRPRKLALPATEDSLWLRRQSYVARLWADDSKDFKIE